MAKLINHFKKNSAHHLYEPVLGRFTGILFYVELKQLSPQNRSFIFKICSVKPLSICLSQFTFEYFWHSMLSIQRVRIKLQISFGWCNYIFLPSTFRLLKKSGKIFSTFRPYNFSGITTHNFLLGIQLL